MNESSDANGQGAEEVPTPASGEPDTSTTEATLSGSDYEFSEPTLGDAEISEDVAESVDLEAAAAEAAAVEREAELATRGVSSGLGGEAPAANEPDWDTATTVLRTDFSQPPVASNSWGQPPAQAPAESPAPAPAQEQPMQEQPTAAEPVATEAATAAVPETPLPAAPTQEPEQAQSAPEPFDAAPTEAAAAPVLGHSVDDGHGWHRPETQWQQSATPWQPKAGAWQSPAQIARGEADAASAAAAAGPPAATGAIPAVPLLPPAPQATAPYGQPAQAAQQPYQPTEQPGTTSQFGAAGPYGQAQPPYGQQPPYGAPTPFGQSATPGGQPPYGAPGGPQGPQGPGYPGGNGGPYPGGPQGPGYPGGPQGPGYPGGPQGPQGPGGNGKKKLFIILGIVVLAVVLMGVLVTLLINFITSNINSAEPTTPTGTQSQTSPAEPDPSESTEPGADVVVPAASPLDWLRADCLRDFKGVSAPADVVLCNSPHSAQLVGTFYYGEDETFPGGTALKAKAAEVCKGVELTTEAESMKDLKQLTAYPSQATWDEADDRRVDCLIQDTSGNNLLSSLIK